MMRIIPPGILIFAFCMSALGQIKSSEPRTIITENGDTVKRIVERYDVDLKTFLDLNLSTILAAVEKFKPDTKLPAGIQLTLPSIPKGFISDYDKFKDRTTISFEESLGYRLRLRGRFGHDGTKLKEDVEFYILTFSGSDCSGYCFRNPGLIFLIDGERVSVDKRENYLEDFAVFMISRDLFKRIANAKTLEYQVYIYEGSLKPEQILKLKTLYDLGTVK